MERISVFKPTLDDWYPSYRLEGLHRGKPLQLVEVSFVEIVDGSWRVCVWGADDFGLEKDHSSRDLAYDMFEEVIKQSEVSQVFLRELGFVHC